MDDVLAGTTGLVVILIVIMWAVLSILAPFFWYGTNVRAREISEKMDELVKIQRRALFQLGHPIEETDRISITPRR